jgi:hypothetical protein
MSKLVHMLLVNRFTRSTVTLSFGKVYLTLSVSWILLYTTVQWSAYIPPRTTLLQQVTTSTRLLLILTISSIASPQSPGLPSTIDSDPFTTPGILHTCWCYNTYFCDLNCSSYIIRFRIFFSASGLHLHYDLATRPSWSTSVLNRNTLPTIHDTELIGLSTQWFQRKQSRLQRVRTT